MRYLSALSPRPHLSQLSPRGRLVVLALLVALFAGVCAATWAVEDRSRRAEAADADVERRRLTEVRLEQRADAVRAQREARADALAAEQLAAEQLAAEQLAAEQLAAEQAAAAAAAAAAAEAEAAAEAQRVAEREAEQQREAEPAAEPEPAPAAPAGPPTPAAPVAPAQCVNDAHSSGQSFHTSAPAAEGDGSNGNIPASQMTQLAWGHDSVGTPQYLTTSAAQALESLNAAYRERFGANLDLDLTYRSYDEQVRMRAALGSVAAQPGTSVHGTGRAIDVPEWSCYKFGSERREWLAANGPAYGWVSPGWAQQNGSNPEYWHYEYVG